MRNLLATVIFIMLPAFLQAQNNLQFNQVLNYQGELYTGNLSSPVYTVPSGKVWKIEYFTPFRSSGSTPPLPFIAPYLNGFAILEGVTSTFWMKAGSTIQYINSNYYISTSPSYQVEYYKAMRSYQLSIIEYNIIP